MMVAVALCAAVGTLAAGAWWRYRPKHYVSTAVMRPQVSDLQVLREAERSTLGDYSLASIIERRSLFPEERKLGGIGAAIRRMRDRSIRVQETESLGPVVVLSFEYSDAATAQKVTSDLVTALQATGMKCEVMAPPSPPMGAVEDQDGALPLTVAGLGGGLMAGFLFATGWRAVRVRSQARRGTASLSG
jgi:hypothetical protein